jgi:Cd2+/Zn2+-exporting ATPase
VAELQLELTLLLPHIDERDDCIHLLTARLATVKGVEYAHLTQNNGTMQLCLHYDPNLLTLSQLQRLAQEAGAVISDRYRHEQIPFARMDAADAATTLTQTLAKLPGMLHAQVNYAAELVFVAYDSEILQRPAIEQAIRRMGIRVLMPAPTETAEHEERDREGHDDGSAPNFLPHWIQERWTLILVALAGLFFLIGWIGARFFGMPENIALIFFILAYLTGGYDIATHAIPSLLKGKFDTDVLMLAAAAGAAILGEWKEGAFLLFLFSLGHAGEHYALDRARNAVNALGALMPGTAQVKRGDQIVEEKVETLQLGDVVVVRPGDRLPVDGQIASGSSAIDQSPITGESVPVEKGPGDEVFAGTINGDGALEIRSSKPAAITRQAT